jgi:TRAP-type C4-dicarboxylate transport system substrate-binding protein
MRTMFGKGKFCLLLSALAVCFLLNLFVPPGAMAAEEKIVIRLAHSNAVNFIRHMSAMKWKELLEKESNGRVEVKVYPNSQIAKSNEEMNALIMGSIDVAAVHGGKISTLVPEWDLFGLLFFWPNDGKSFEPAWKFKQSEAVKKIMVPKLEKKGIKFLGFVTGLGVSASFSTNTRPVRKVADFAGLKMNTLGGWLRVEAAKSLGFSLVSIPKAEVGQALAQGTVDGELSTLADALTSGYPIKYIHWWPAWTYDGGSCFVMSMAKWKSLPDDIKKIIDEKVTPETQKWTNEQIIVEEYKAVDELKKRGVTFVEPDPGTVEECIKRLSHLADMYQSKFGEDGKVLIKAAREMGASY